MPRKSRKNVGLIGLGIIGSRVAAGLRAAGFHVFVWNRTAKPAPNFVGSPAELAELCEIIQLFVADAQALFDVIDQMRDVLTSQHVIICNATVGPEATIEAARLVEEKGAHFLDAPFTGSKGAAEKRSLVYYIGGEDSVFLRARPVLEASSKTIVRIGGVGHAATVKIVTNMIAAVSIQTLGEALAIVQKAGLDPEVLAAALEQNACRSATMDMKLPKMIASDYDPHFSLKHMFKDVQLGIHIANALDIEIPATTVTAGVMYGALNQGWGDLDFSSLYKIYEPQVRGETAAAAELQAEMVQLDDLDPKELHYPETTVAAPPRPESLVEEEGPFADIVAESSVIHEAKPVVEVTHTPEVPTLAAVLNASEESPPATLATPSVHSVPLEPVGFAAPMVAVGLMASVESVAAAELRPEPPGPVHLAPIPDGEAPKAEVPKAEALKPEMPAPPVEVPPALETAAPVTPVAPVAETTRLEAHLPSWPASLLEPLPATPQFATPLPAEAMPPPDAAVPLPAGAPLPVVAMPPSEAAAIVAASAEPVEAIREAVPEPSKVVEFAPAPETASKMETVAVASPATATSSDHSKNGTPEDSFETTAKPFNFVKRWFVSRTGG